MTGSSSLLRVHGTADCLAGRLARLETYGLSQGELNGRRDDFASRIRSDAEGLVQFRDEMTRLQYADMLARGTDPEVRTMGTRSRNRWLDSYIRSIVGRDMQELRRQVRPPLVMTLLRAPAGRQSVELVKDILAHETSIHPNTITEYLDLVLDVGLVTSIPPWTPNLSKREIGRQKILLLDAPLAIRRVRMTPEQLARMEYEEALGAMVEAFVAAELLKQQTWSEQEFDLVLELPEGAVIGIEVKAAGSFNRSQFSGLARLRDQLGDRLLAGIVLNTAPHGYRYVDRLYGAPVSALWGF